MSKSTLIICNDAPYGNERLYNGLRLALSLARRERGSVKLFLIGDAVLTARPGQVLPDGYYNLERMLQGIGRAGADVGVCGTCLDARGLANGSLVDGTHRGTMEELTDWTLAADKVVVF